MKTRLSLNWRLVAVSRGGCYTVSSIILLDNKNVLSVRSTFSSNTLQSLVSKLIVRFGKQIKELRKSIGMTQEEFAEKVGVSKDYIGLIERGLRNPSFYVIEKLAKSLGVRVEDLFKEVPKK